MVSWPFFAPASPPETGASTKPNPRASRFRRQLARQPRGSRGVIDEHRALPHGAKAPSAPVVDLAHIGIAADASEHEVGASRRGGGRRRAALPPYSATHCSAFAAVRLNTTT